MPVADPENRLVITVEQEWFKYLRKHFIPGSAVLKPWFIEAENFMLPYFLPGRWPVIAF